MKKVFLLLAVLLTSLIGNAQINIPWQEINYNIHYHWGFVNVMIAHGKVTLQCEGGNFYGTLDGNSIPWDGRVLCISDTLQATMSPGRPLSRETVTYENGWYLKPKVTVFNSGAFDPRNPANYKNIQGGGTLDADADTMEAVTVTADMIGMFYYFREINFDGMSPGQQITIPIAVAGGSPKSVSVTYNGKSSYDIGGVTYPSYACSFEYSYDGTMSGYPVKAEVSSSDRIPLLLSAELPVGHVEMIREM